VPLILGFVFACAVATGVKHDHESLERQGIIVGTSSARAWWWLTFLFAIVFVPCYFLQRYRATEPMRMQRLSRYYGTGNGGAPDSGPGPLHHPPTVPPPVPGHVRFCSRCGQALGRGARFCQACGVSVQPHDLV